MTETPQTYDQFSDELHKFLKSYLTYSLDEIDKIQFLYWFTFQIKRYSGCQDSVKVGTACGKFADKLYKYPDHLPAKIKFRRYIAELLDSLV